MNTEHQPSPIDHKTRMLWFLWFTMVSSYIMLTVIFDLGNLIQVGDSNDAETSSLVYLGLVPLAISTLIRWFLLPKAKHSGALLVYMLIGLATAEACGILGLLLQAPALYILGAAGLAQYIPLYASKMHTRFQETPTQTSNAL